MAVNLRWGVNFLANFGKKILFLSVNKIGFERVDELKEVKMVKKMSSEGNMDDLEMLKGLLSWMKRELDVLHRENIEMKHNLEEMKLANSKRNYGGGKKLVPIMKNSSEFEQWRSKKSGGEEIGKKESSKVVNLMSNVHSSIYLGMLEKLGLDNNKIFGEFSMGIQGLRELNELNLTNNRLFGKIPDEIGNLSGLNYLDLYGNSFRDFCYACSSFFSPTILFQ